MQSGPLGTGAYAVPASQQPTVRKPGITAVFFSLRGGGDPAGFKGFTFGAQGFSQFASLDRIG